MFVARLSYDAKESDLEKEFGRYGPIERVILLLPDPEFHPNEPQIRIITDKFASPKNDDDDEKPKKKPKKKSHRGYAFIVYEREKDMKGKSPLFPQSAKTMAKVMIVD